MRDINRVQGEPWISIFSNIMDLGRGVKHRADAEVAEVSQAQLRNIWARLWFTCLFAVSPNA